VGLESGVSLGQKLQLLVNCIWLPVVIALSVHSGISNVSVLVLVYPFWRLFGDTVGCTGFLVAVFVDTGLLVVSVWTVMDGVVRWVTMEGWGQ